MATTGSQIEARVRRILQDEGVSPYWTVNELIDWINDAQMEIVSFKPDAYSTQVNVSMVAGTKQSISGLMLLEVTRNMGTGSTPGDVPSKVPLDVINTFIPDWHSHTAQAAVEFWMYDQRLPMTFWVYPPQPSPATQVLETMQASRPTALTVLTGSLALDDKYVPDVVNYVLFRAWSKAGDIQGSLAKSNGAYQLFMNGLGVKDKSQMVLNLKGAPAQPQPQAGGAA